MRTTLKIADDALLAARRLAQREGIPLGDSVSERVRRGARAIDVAAVRERSTPLRGRFALLPERDEVITP